MSSEELARKLQRRLDAEQRDPKPGSPAQTGADEEQPSPVRPSTAVNGDASSELTEKLARRLDIHDGTAKPNQMKVFNPYTEFKEFSRNPYLKQNIKTMRWELLETKTPCITARWWYSG
ncbi:EF-hand domain-containing protein D1-like [Sinocyclocheilus rhinocerous]|uniref:EF-hand domain-containing protein D1-like n=1 Tax=Sinocyclocheilus rhinocerous TaxID=307959 RepID=UPI0007BA7875|nr:PREDICTED: EF-hand domain-containing protein D1-like [Sinocyclocheilus rhinocerous]